MQLGDSVGLESSSVITRRSLFSQAQGSADQGDEKKMPPSLPLEEEAEEATEKEGTT